MSNNDPRLWGIKNILPLFFTVFECYIALNSDSWPFRIVALFAIIVSWLVWYLPERLRDQTATAEEEVPSKPPSSFVRRAIWFGTAVALIFAQGQLKHIL